MVKELKWYRHKINPSFLFPCHSLTRSHCQVERITRSFVCIFQIFPVHIQTYSYTCIHYLKIHKYVLQFLVGNRWQTQIGELMERYIKTWPELRSTRNPSNSGVLLLPPWARPRWPLGRTWPPLNYRPLGGRPGRGRRNEHTDFCLLPSNLHVKLHFLLNSLSGWKAPPCTWLTKSKTWASFCISPHSPHLISEQFLLLQWL